MNFRLVFRRTKKAQFVIFHEWPNCKFHRIGYMLI